MPTGSDQKQQIDFTKQLLNLVQANQEIAVMRIGRLRDEVIKNREISKGLATVYSTVRSSHQTYLKKQKKEEKISAMLIISTNKRLSGAISANSIRFGLKHAAENPDEKVIIAGRLGKQRFEEKFPGRKFDFFDVDTEKADLQTMAPLIKKALSYGQLTVFYPEYDNAIHQVPVKRIIGEDLAAQEAQQTSKGKEQQIVSYFFEPSLQDIVGFFDDQIFALVLQQLFTESDLALVGSRITAMELAANVIGEELKNQEKIRRRNKKQLQNKKQRERLAGMILWQR